MFETEKDKKNNLWKNVCINLINKEIEKSGMKPPNL